MNRKRKKWIFDLLWVRHTWNALLPLQTLKSPMFLVNFRYFQNIPIPWQFQIRTRLAKLEDFSSDLSLADFLTHLIFFFSFLSFSCFTEVMLTVHVHMFCVFMMLPWPQLRNTKCYNFSRKVNDHNWFFFFFFWGGSSYSNFLVFIGWPSWRHVGSSQSRDNRKSITKF